MVAMNSAPTAPVTPAMATTGSFFTLLSSYLSMIFSKNRYPLFRIMLQTIKKPRTLQAGLRFR
jgi:hypothetical protein